jgi:hypothetical protein
LARSSQGGVPIDSLAMVVLTEQFLRSLAQFEATLGRDVSGERYSNINPSRWAASLENAPDVRKAMETHRQRDIELYRYGEEIYRREATRRGVWPTVVPRCSVMEWS